MRCALLLRLGGNATSFILNKMSILVGLDNCW